MRMERARLAKSTRGAVMHSDGRDLHLHQNSGGGASGSSHAGGEAESSPRVVLFRGDSFGAACWSLVQDPTCSLAVLDFASDSEPGGGYKGNQRGTQEESLCRRSNLALGLEALAASYPIPTLGAAYVPEVCVFRAGEDAGYALWPEPVWLGGVIAAALRSADAGDGALEPRQAAFLRSKIDGILSIAKHHSHRAVVLGAWGCGAFGNSAQCVASVFHEALRGPHGLGLDTVIFALVGNEKFLAFHNVFQMAEQVPAASNLVSVPAASPQPSKVLEVLACELVALAGETSVWDAALATVQDADMEPASLEAVRAVCQRLVKALMVATLNEAEATLPEYSDEVAALRAAAGAETPTEELCKEVIAAANSLQEEARERVKAHVDVQGWLRRPSTH